MIKVKRFTATWCGPCKTLAPVFEQIQASFPDVTFETIDVDENKEVIDRPRFGIAKYAGYSATDDQVILKTDKGRMYVKSQYVKIKK